MMKKLHKKLQVKNVIKCKRKNSSCIFCYKAKINVKEKLVVVNN